MVVKGCALNRPLGSGKGSAKETFQSHLNGYIKSPGPYSHHGSLIIFISGAPERTRWSHVGVGTELAENLVQFSVR